MISLIFTFGVVTLFLCSSCANYTPSVNTVSNANPHANIKVVEDLRIITDSAFANALAVLEVREATSNDGYQKVQVFLKNYATCDIGVKYRFNWYDADGMEVEAPGGMWKEITIHPGDDLTLASMAPSRKCKDFKLRLLNAL